MPDKLSRRFPLRLLSWGVTNQCNLNCIYCYRDAGKRLPEELSTSEGMKLMSEARDLGNRVFILSGGEPLLREDIFDLVRYGSTIGLNVFLATTGTLLSESLAIRLREAGAKGVSVTIDGHNPEVHERIRGVKSSFEKTLNGIENALRAGLTVQVNITALKPNYLDIPDIIRKVTDMGISFIHVFSLIPTGRGKKVDVLTLSAEEQQTLLRSIFDLQNSTDILIKPTCMPYYWALLEEEKPAFHGRFIGMYPKGCVAGVSYLYVSPVGDVAPCPYTPLSLGNIRENSLKEIWKNSPVLKRMRSETGLKGKCGVCIYRNVCGGCRAKAWIYSGDLMDEDPLCPIWL